jgi:HD-GYP domain-containing protein (c-di-GMP phosphodiesterase class II)/HAMP domain-containing protein
MSLLNHSPFNSLRVRLLMMVLVSIIPALFLTLYDGITQHQVATDMARDKTLRWARLAQANQHQIISAAQELLLSIEPVPAIRANGPIDCSALLSEILKSYPFYSNLGIMQADGKIICSATTPFATVIPLNEHPYFQRIFQTGRSPFGEFEVSTIIGSPTINIGILTIENSEPRIIFASLDTSWFSLFTETSELPSGATLIITDRRKILTTRNSNARDAIRLSTADARIDQLGTHETALIFNDADQVTRLYAFVPVQNGAGYIGVGIPLEIAYAEADRLTQRNLVGLGFVAVIASLAAWIFSNAFVVRPVRTLITMTNRLSAGDLNARTGNTFGSDEIGQLAHAFDAMATDLQRRETERARAAAAEHEQRAIAESLRDTAAALNSTLDFDRVLDQILDNVGRVVPHDTSNIMLVEDNQLRVVRSRGYNTHGGEAWLLAQRFDLDMYSNLKQILVQNTISLIADTHHAENWVTLPESQWIRSRLGAPIRFKGRPVGILNLDSATPGFFNGTHILRLQAFADQAGIALENARLLRHAEMRAKEFAALYATANDLAAPQRGLPLLLQSIVERAASLLNTFVGMAYLYDPYRDDLELIAQKGLNIAPGLRLKMGEGLAGQVALARKPLGVKEYSRWEHRSPQFSNAGLTFVLAVPMMYGGELIGVLGVAQIQNIAREFTDDDIRLLTLFAGQAASVVRNTRLFEETRTRTEQLTLLYDAGLALNSVLELHAQLDFFFKTAMQALHADRTEFFRFIPENNWFELEMHIGFSELVQRDMIKLNQPLSNEKSVIAWVGRTRMPLYLPDVQADERWIVVDPQVKSGMWVSVQNDTELLGVFAVLSTRLHAFTPEDERLLVLFANQAAVALRNARLFADLETSQNTLTRAYDATLEGWSSALDLRDEETEGHTQRVTEVALRLARTMNIQGEALEHLRRGALLHDIGKMGIPDRILFKPGPLNPEEWIIMKKHPVYAHDFISRIEYLRPALDIPFCHHERWDGTGYPRGLKGIEIPLAARIFAIADVWDALLSQRPYREAWSRTKVLDHIQALGGTHLDPHLVRAFLELMKSD